MRLKELAQVFLLEGILGFGGPAAHLAMMESDVVKRRQWLTHEQFMDTLAASNLIPGPTSTQMAIHIGYMYAGLPGLIVAGFCFILPAALITLGFAWLYSLAGTVPALTHLFTAIGPAVLVIILDAFWRLAKKSISSLQLALIAVFVAASVLLGLSEIVALLLGGFFSILLSAPRTKNVLVLPLLLGSVGKIAVVQPGLLQLGLFFLKIGSILFGGGYVLFAFLQGEMVQQQHWLTQQQLVDAIAVGQFTPGPILSTATFIGYLILGIPGAIVATVAIFLPSFFLVFITNPLIPKMQQSRVMKAFLDGLKAGSVALIAVVAFSIFSKFNWLLIILTILNAILIFRLHLRSTWIILIALLVGLLQLT
jgi:chromate transporter